MQYSAIQLHNNLGQAKLSQPFFLTWTAEPHNIRKNSGSSHEEFKIFNSPYVLYKHGRTSYLADGQADKRGQ